MTFKFSERSREWEPAAPALFYCLNRFVDRTGPLPEGGYGRGARTRTLETDGTARVDIDEPRLVQEAGLEARITAIVEPVIRNIGYRLVRVRLSQMNGQTLQIMAERPDGTMSVVDCEKVSNAVSPVLDIEDPIAGEYNLEVSSPGIDRPLVRRSDFETWSGHVAKLETSRLIDGRKRFKGRIIRLDGNRVEFRRDDAAKDETDTFTLELGDIADAKLVLSDDLIREALRRDKALRKANNIEEPDEDLDEDDEFSGDNTADN
ncbi:MAG: ribosome maturation factor RimP [Nitratireductor sp.]|nr:ribosome maturation factor RimP [Nitratireductor sp.]MCC0021676.1 ribosome maturation factor RimP [Nitratireductor sp.]